MSKHLRTVFVGGVIIASSALLSTKYGKLDSQLVNPHERMYELQSQANKRYTVQDFLNDQEQIVRNAQAAQSELETLMQDPEIKIAYAGFLDKQAEYTKKGLLAACAGLVGSIMIGYGGIQHIDPKPRRK